MKKFCYLFFYYTLQIISGKAQNIPSGVSMDTVYLPQVLSNSNYQPIYYYKPSTYNLQTSPLLFACHGDGGNGMSEINDLINIAERRKALIVAPNLQGGGPVRIQEAVYSFVDSVSLYAELGPATYVFKAIYNHVLQRESRPNIASYLIGFSAGAQFVTRYMLIRQAYPDSIPLQMAVSSNAYYYTFPTDTYMGVPMPWLCGVILPTVPGLGYGEDAFKFYNWNCSEHINQYYNENYGVLIGTGDTQPLSDNACAMAQGSNRYERALNFYNFCDSNAVNRGTTLQWPYVEIAGVGHDQYTMYNAKVNATDSSTIAETLLFDTPHHTVPSLAPLAAFHADFTTINVNGTVNFTNTSTLATTYLWVFGDGDSSTATNPSHIYTTPGLYSVQLYAINGAGCDNWAIIRHYIRVLGPQSINEQQDNVPFSMQPNPFTDMLTVTHPSAKGSIFITDITGKKVYSTTFTNNIQQQLQLAWLQQGMYFITCTINGAGSTKKIIKL